MKVLSTSLVTPGLSTDRPRAKLINFAPHTDCPVNLPKGEQPQPAACIITSPQKQVMNIVQTTLS